MFFGNERAASGILYKNSFVSDLLGAFKSAFIWKSAFIYYKPRSLLKIVKMG